MADDILTAFAGDIAANPASHATLLLAAALLAEAVQIVVVGDEDTPGFTDLFAAAAASAVPARVLQRLGPDERRLPASHPAAGKHLLDGRAAAYVCRGTTCEAPLVEPGDLACTIDPARTGRLKEAKMAHRISAQQHGGPEVLEYESYDVPAPGPGEALVRHAAIGLNYIDVYHRTGLYPGTLPLTPGMEGCRHDRGGRTRRHRPEPGQRVAYAGAPVGAYADLRVMPADMLVPLPDSISFETAAAMMLKGMTAQYLLRQTYAVKPGDTILFHAAAGGVGLIVGQWAKHLGATVIGTVELARKGRARQGAWLRPRHRLQARGFRGTGQGDHRRAGRAGRL